MRHTVTLLHGGRPVRERESLPAVFLPLMIESQPDTAERVRLAVQAIPFALPEKRDG